ncbi:Acyl-CoA dehydrogenase [Klenkia marina]|uniref:Acyl-CoA dehydrogenase n=1 Tax=Klenkia marina TaxID=1960309 RepID=A0A1G4YLS9_9ACTN|nr:acyl-CoA dehydrogenase family protein [Klenkia marina]SCX54447.1 Acyl-CoA dehydrogenase [Klenkia marina]
MTATLSAGSPDLTLPPTPLEVALAAVVERREEFRALGHVPRDVVDLFKAAGVYRAATPRRFGGDALPPAEFLGVVERIATADGSAGWVASFGSAQVYLAALPLETQAELFADGPDLCFAGGLFPIQPATPTERGFLVEGRWKWASGCMGADVLGVGIPGDPSTEGKPRTALLRPDQVEIVQDWDVVGMAGTGSYDVVVRGVEVPRERTFIRGGQPTVDEPLYRYPALAYAAQVLAVVGLGIGRAALDWAREVGGGGTGATGAPKLADRAYFRTAVAEAEARLRGARAFFYEAAEEAYATVLDGDPVTDEQNALLRLSATHAARAGSEAVRAVFDISGTNAIYSDHPLQPLVRDSMVPTQHAFLGPAMYDAAGAVLMGLPATVPAFR